jgi:hypothetical protein
VEEAGGRGAGVVALVVGGDGEELDESSSSSSSLPRLGWTRADEVDSGAGWKQAKVEAPTTGKQLRGRRRTHRQSAVRCAFSEIELREWVWRRTWRRADRYFAHPFVQHCWRQVFLRVCSRGKPRRIF